MKIYLLPRKLNSQTWIKLFPATIIFTLLFFTEILSQTVNLKIIETSDVHGAVFPYDFKNDKDMNGSLAQVYSFVKSEREKQDQEVILLDNGDILQGQPAVYYYNFEKTDTSHIYADVMNYMGYDAATIGNHDIETGHPVYDKFMKEIKFPWLAANAVNTKTGEPYFKPYLIIEKKGIKIAVIGLITPGIPSWLPETIWKGIDFEDMIASAKKWMKVINEKEKPDVIVGLFHSGVEYEYNNQTAGTYKNENASRLIAEQVTGFDVIFVGHDHKGWNTSFKNPDGKNVNILAPTSSAQNIACADILCSYNPAEKKWDKQVKGSIVEMSSYKADEQFMQKFDHAFREVKEYVSAPIGYFTETISTREALFGNSAFVDLIHNVQLDLTKADVSFADPLSFDAQINKGTVHVRDMFNLYRYENLLYTMNLTGNEIKDYLEYSYGSWFNQMKDSGDHLISFKDIEKNEETNSVKKYSYELTTQYYNYSSAAGIIYTIDVSKPAGSRVNISSMSDGQVFDPGKTYKVAVNSYRGNGGGGHLIYGSKIRKEDLSERVISSTEKDLRYYLMKWIKDKGTVTPKKSGNWKVIPEAWWAKGKEKDYNILFDGSTRWKP